MIIEYLLTSWKIGHSTRQMTYSNGYLTVNQTGYYYIYCQLYSQDGVPTAYDFFLSIENKPQLRVIKSTISRSRKFSTNYIGGVFKIKAGQSISVRTRFKYSFTYESTESFFGAFIIHP